MTPCPKGRVEIEGVVLSVRVDETPFGSVTKVLVKHDTGYRVWGTRPKANKPGTDPDKWVPCPQVGDRIAFCARVTPSDTDPKFGFFTRPTAGRILARKQEVA